MWSSLDTLQQPANIHNTTSSHSNEDASERKPCKKSWSCVPTECHGKKHAEDIRKSKFNAQGG
eukprot:167342-Amphidinium_carterae.1